MLNYDQMDELSHDFAHALFGAFPDWERLARTIGDANSGRDSLLIDIPQEGTDRVLHLTATNDDITIAIDRWHTEVGPFLTGDISESVAMALMIIKDFVAEKTVVEVSTRDGVWIESGLGDRVGHGEPTPNSRTEVFSWRGTYDDTSETPPKAKAAIP